MTDTTDQQAVTVAINSDDRDTAKEWWQIWDGGKTQMPWSLQYQFALHRHRLASVSSASAETLALQAIKVVTATAKDGAAGLSRIMAIANAAGVQASYSDLLQDPAVALIVERPRAEWAHLFKPDAKGCAIPPEGWQCSRARGHAGPCAASPEPVLATNQAGEVCKLYAIVDVIANADDDDTISCLYVNISDGLYSRQWLRDAARDALLSRVPIEAASLTDVEEIKNILFKCIRYEATTEYQLGGVTGHSEAAAAVVLAIKAKTRGYETARPALATTPAKSQKADVVEAVARAMCDRVNGIGDYDENVQQRRSGWVKQAEAAIAAYVVATQPATSQEGEGFSREWCLNMAALEGNAEISAGSLDHPLRTATPTPPTLSEDLREIMARLPAAPWRVTRSLLDGFGASLEVDNDGNFGNIGHIRDYDTACALADLVREVAGSQSMLATNIITEEWLADVLQDSLEMDWTSTDGARAIMSALAQVKAS